MSGSVTARNRIHFTYVLFVNFDKFLMCNFLYESSC